MACMPLQNGNGGDSTQVNHIASSESDDADDDLDEGVSIADENGPDPDGPDQEGSSVTDPSDAD